MSFSRRRSRERQRTINASAGNGGVTLPAYYVSADGNGDGLLPSDPMSQQDLALVVLEDDDRIFFLADDVY